MRMIAGSATLFAFALSGCTSLQTVDKALIYKDS